MAQLFFIKMNNPYIRYYLDQQGHRMPVFRDSRWQLGHGQMGYGLDGLFCNISKTVMPMVKSGAKALGNIALNSGANFIGDVLTGKNVKEAAKARTREAADATKQKAVQRLRTYAQTGSRRRHKKTTAKKRAKKRNTSMPTTRSNPTKKQKTTPADIFG